MDNRLSSITRRDRFQPMPTPWSLYSWPVVFCQANLQRTLNFVHLGTRVSAPLHSGRPATGHTLWGECTPSEETGLAWDWVDIGAGVLAMADPMGIFTNLRLVSRRGTVLTETESALYLNRLVRQLPWQDQVRQVLLSA